jgi:pimeloyl-ACP methyl ester carboxylesterase
MRRGYGRLPPMMKAWSGALALLALGLAGCSGSSTPATATSPSPGDSGPAFASGDVRLSYALDLPGGTGPFPALVFGHGSGRSTKQDSAGLASRLAARGYAVLRYDKRGVGLSGGTYENVGVGNSERMIGVLAGDMAAGAAFLATRPEIDSRRIGLIGGSQAGWIMPAAAARGGIWCMVLLVGPTVSVGEEIFYSNLAEGTTTPFDELSLQLAGFRGARGYDPRPVLQRIDVPGYWILGAQDRSIPTRETVAILEELAAAGKPYRWNVHPNAGHSLQGVDVTTEALAFLQTQR